LSPKITYDNTKPTVTFQLTTPLSVGDTKVNYSLDIQSENPLTSVLAFYKEVDSQGKFISTGELMANEASGTSHIRTGEFSLPITIKADTRVRILIWALDEMGNIKKGGETFTF